MTKQNESQSAVLMEIARQHLTPAQWQFLAKMAAIVNGGVRWHGDKASYGDMSNAIHAAKLYEERTGQTWQARWKSVGGYVTVDLPAMQDALLIVGAFILAAYGREDAIIQLLDEAASAAEMISIFTDQIDSGWPNLLEEGMLQI